MVPPLGDTAGSTASPYTSCMHPKSHYASADASFRALHKHMLQEHGNPYYQDDDDDDSLFQDDSIFERAEQERVRPVSGPQHPTMQPGNQTSQGGWQRLFQCGRIGDVLDGEGTSCSTEGQSPWTRNVARALTRFFCRHEADASASTSCKVVVRDEGYGRPMQPCHFPGGAPSQQFAATLA